MPFLSPHRFHHKDIKKKHMAALLGEINISIMKDSQLNDEINLHEHGWHGK